MQTNAHRCHCLTQDAHMNGLIYNCLPSDMIFNFSPPISVEQASILDHLGFLFCFAGGSVVSKYCFFQLISQRVGANPFQGRLYWYTQQQQGVKIKHPGVLT